MSIPSIPTEATDTISWRAIKRRDAALAMRAQGLTKHRRHVVDGLWFVPSSKGTGGYIVDRAALPVVTCTCPDYTKRVLRDSAKVEQYAKAYGGKPMVLAPCDSWCKHIWLFALPNQPTLAVSPPYEDDDLTPLIRNVLSTLVLTETEGASALHNILDAVAAERERRR